MTRKYYLAGLLLVVAAAVATTLAYPQLPGSVPTHWDLNGRPNGFSPKWTLYLIGPGLLTGIMGFTWLLPWLSPRHFLVEDFRPTYLRIMLMTMGLLTYCHFLILWSGMGHDADVSRAVLGGVGVLFILLGNVMGKVRRNFYIGIRTPWALASERVWNATHRLAAKTFVAGGMIGLLLVAAGSNLWLPLIATLSGALVPAAYSLVFSKQLERSGEL